VLNILSFSTFVIGSHIFSSLNICLDSAACIFIENINNIINNNKFYKIFSDIIQYEVFWKKRHEWSINFPETRKTRSLLIWNFKDKNSLIYQLTKISEIDY